LIGEALAVACSDPAVLARIGGRIGEAARAAQAELAELEVPARRVLRAKLAAVVRAPVPAGIRGVHASWIEAGLVGLPRRARVALASGDGSPVGTWLVRWACAELPPLPAIDPALRAPHSIDEAIRLSGAALEDWLASIGADQLALVLRAAGTPVVAAAAVRLAGDRLHAAMIRIAVPPRVDALGPARAAILRAGIPGTPAKPRGPVDEQAATHLAHPGEHAATRAQPGLAGDHLLVRIGARAIAAYADGLVRRQLAVRLPRPLGGIVHDELVAHAATPVAHCPTWPALAAAW
jgi:hypothetical protein